MLSKKRQKLLKNTIPVLNLAVDHSFVQRPLSLLCPRKADRSFWPLKPRQKADRCSSSVSNPIKNFFINKRLLYIFDEFSMAVLRASLRRVGEKLCFGSVFGIENETVLPGSFRSELIFLENAIVDQLLLNSKYSLQL